MYYYKSGNQYESRSIKSIDVNMIEITKEEYDHALNEIIAKAKAESEKLQTSNNIETLSE